MSEIANSVGISLADVLKGAQVPSQPFPLVTSCTNDWRQVQPGDAFIAVTEPGRDGHDDAQQAIDRGAAVIVCERHLPVFGVPQWIVEDTRLAYGMLCQALVGNPCDDLRLIGITGTAGKSSVVALLASVLNVAGGRAGTIGSLGYSDGIDHVTAFTATPSPPLLAHWLARISAAGCTHAIVELSSQALAELRPAGLELDAACVTNVRRQHLDYHGSLANYRKAKARIFDYLGAGGVAVLNADDPACCRMLATLDYPVMTFGMRNPAEVTAEIVEQHENEQIIVMTADADSVGVRTNIVGDHHVYNCLTAAALGMTYGIDLTTIALGLEAVQHIPVGPERIGCDHDMAMTPC